MEQPRNCDSLLSSAIDYLYKIEQGFFVVVGKEIELKDIQVFTGPQCHQQLEFEFLICRACPVTRLTFLSSSAGTVLLCIS